MYSSAELLCFLYQSRPEVVVCCNCDPTQEGAVVEGAAHKDEDDDPEAELHPTPYQEIDSDTAIA